MSDDEIRRLLGDDPADIVVCGGSHVPFDRTVMEVRVIGIGSVGEAPGDIPHADATFIEIAGPTGAAVTTVDQLTVPLSS